MPKLDISINGRFYPVSCDPGQEARVVDLAAMLDSRVRQLAGRGAPLGDSHFLVLAALTLVDELTDALAAGAGEQAAQAIPEDRRWDEDQAVLVAAVNHLTQRISAIADRLRRA
jgi:cell division protein ZapA